VLGWRDGDVIVALDDQPVATAADLVEAGAILFAADGVRLTIVRDGSTITLRYRRGD
jgi:S1-C subfamily serine protease